MLPLSYSSTSETNRKPHQRQVLKGHDKGILSVAWCKDDSDLIISSGKDGRTIAWGASTGEIVAEVSRNLTFVPLSFEIADAISNRSPLRRTGLSTPLSVLATPLSSVPLPSTEPSPFTLYNRPTLPPNLPPSNNLPHLPRTPSTLPLFSNKLSRRTLRITLRNHSLTHRNGSNVPLQSHSVSEESSFTFTTIAYLPFLEEDSHPQNSRSRTSSLLNRSSIALRNSNKLRLVNSREVSLHSVMSEQQNSSGKVERVEK